MSSLDPAAGSGGMFVQSSHFIEDKGRGPDEAVTFYGHEKNETTAKLAQINLAVHGLQGSIWPETRPSPTIRTRTIWPESVTS